MENIINKINNFKTVILCSLSIDKDIFLQDLKYEVGDFSIAGLHNYKNLQEVIDSINPHGEICEGFGYKEYCDEIKNSVLTCVTSGKKASFIIPMLNGEETENFLLTIVKNNNEINLLFIYFDDESGLSNIDTFVSDSFKDRLTGLFNFATLKSHFADNKRDGYLCLFDLNKFKAINDTFGHAAGDDVLMFTSSYLIAISSPDEVYYRRSGDEFMVIFFRTDLEYILSIINKIETYLEELSSTSLKQYVGLECSASFGLLEVKYTAESPINYLDRIKLTDLAMYQAKKAHKRYHIISHEDALNILSMGNLDERLEKLNASIKR